MADRLDLGNNRQIPAPEIKLTHASDPRAKAPEYGARV
jgi:hypothetical protein